jgi:hypothetical protein
MRPGCPPDSALGNGLQSRRIHVATSLGPRGSMDISMILSLPSRCWDLIFYPISLFYFNKFLKRNSSSESESAFFE